MESFPKKSNSTTYSWSSSLGYSLMCSTRSEQQPTVSAVSPSSFSLPALRASCTGNTILCCHWRDLSREELNNSLQLVNMGWKELLWLMKLHQRACCKNVNDKNIMVEFGNANGPEPLYSSRGRAWPGGGQTKRRRNTRAVGKTCHRVCPNEDTRTGKTKLGVDSRQPRPSTKLYDCEWDQLWVQMWITRYTDCNILLFPRHPCLKSILGFTPRIIYSYSWVLDCINHVRVRKWKRHTLNVVVFQLYTDAVNSSSGTTFTACSSDWVFILTLQCYSNLTLSMKYRATALCLILISFDFQSSLYWVRMRSTHFFNRLAVSYFCQSFSPCSSTRGFKRIKNNWTNNSSETGYEGLPWSWSSDSTWCTWWSPGCSLSKMLARSPCCHGEPPSILSQGEVWGAWSPWRRR